MSNWKSFSSTMAAFYCAMDAELTAQRPARTLDQAWQCICTILAWIKTLSVLCDAGVIHHGEAEAALARRQNMAGQRCESVGEGMDSGLDLLIGIHNRVFPDTAGA